MNADGVRTVSLELPMIEGMIGGNAQSADKKCYLCECAEQILVCSPMVMRVSRCSGICIVCRCDWHEILATVFLIV